jgi:predicted Fe-Mo cluster-binding NifX family protein
MSEERLIAVAAEDDRGLCGRVSSHFGRCPFYVLVAAKDSMVLGSRVVANPYLDLHRPGVMPRFIRDLGADVIVAGGMGPQAINMFRSFGIEVATVPIDTVATALTAYLGGEHRGVVPCDHAHSGHCHESG